VFQQQVVPTSDRPQQDSHLPSTPTVHDVHWQDDHIAQQHEQRASQLEKLLHPKQQDPQSDQAADSPKRNIRQHQAAAFRLMPVLFEQLILNLLKRSAPVLR
jgi:predicted outer membrane protein